MIVALLVVLFIAATPEPPKESIKLDIPSVSTPELFGRNNMLDFMTLRGMK